MRPRIGDLAIVKFDNGQNGVKYTEIVCIVIDSFTFMKSNKVSREYTIIYADKIGNKVHFIITDMPLSRLFRVVPNKKWNGVFTDLSIDDVITK